MVGSETNGPTTEEVREAVLEDAEVLHALVKELAVALGDRSPRFRAMRARLDELLAEPGARVLVAEGAEGIVGAASLWIKPDLAHGASSIGESVRALVAEACRVRGVSGSNAVED